LPDETAVEVDGKRLKLSNLEKVLYPATGFTKGEVLDYYTRISAVMLPHLADRPVTLRRFPDGVEAGSFYAKNVPRGAPRWLRTVRVPGDGSSEPGAERKSPLLEFVVLDDLASLLFVANLASLELHVPQWRVTEEGRPARPDLLVLDLDPGEPATIVECCRVAISLRDELRRDGMEAVAKTSGGKGMQLYAPVPAGDPPLDTRDYARDLAERLEVAQRDLVVSNMRKSLRRGKVLVDWSQNSPAKTTVAVYSLRANPQPTASTPVTWEEVERTAAAGDPSLLRFLALDTLARVESHGDLFAPLLRGG
jgi:bifunctional non-homologous end joining protein LigD